MSLLARVYDEVQSQLLLPLERLHTDGAHVRPVGVVRLFVACEVVFTFQGRIADVADKPRKKKNCLFRLLRSIQL